MFKVCAWVSKSPDQRCGLVGDDGTPAAQACCACLENRKAALATGKVLIENCACCTRGTPRPTTQELLGEFARTSPAAPDAGQPRFA
jgi:hypothetical protein